MLPVESAFKVYTDLNGNPLDNGYVYFGLPNQNPITAPVTVYWDAAGTQPAAQPLRTQDGYIVRSGTPANVFYGGTYSQIVQDKNRRQIYYARNSDDYSIANVVTNLISNLASSIGSSLMGFIQALSNAVAMTVQTKLRKTLHVTDFEIGSGVSDDKAKLQTLFDEVAAAGGGEIIFDSQNDYLTSDTVYPKSNTVIRFTGKGFLKLTGSSTNGAVMVMLGTSATPVENVRIYNPRIDAGNFGYPTSSTYGENGLAGSKCRDIKVFGGFVKNCRRGASSPVGTGGKAVQFEDGVDDILVDGLTAQDCTIAMETGGVIDIASPYNFRRNTGILYANMKAVRCERLISVHQSISPPDTSVSVTSVRIDGVLALNCGCEAVAGTEKNFGAIVLDRASNVSIKNVSIFNDASYGTLGALVRQASGTNCDIEVEFTGDVDVLALHDVGSTGFGTTGTCQDNTYRFIHKGTTGYVVSYVAGPTLQENLYEVETDVVSTGFVNGAAALASLYLKLISGGKSINVEGPALSIFAFLSNAYPAASFALAGTLRVNGMNISTSAGAQTISSMGTDVLRLLYSGTNRVECNTNGVLLNGIPTFADNAAATAGGLAVGQMYRTATGQAMIRF